MCLPVGRRFRVHTLSLKIIQFWAHEESLYARFFTAFVLSYTYPGFRILDARLRFKLGKNDKGIGKA